MDGWRGTRSRDGCCSPRWRSFLSVGVWVAYYNEAQGNPLMRGMAVDQGAGNWEGKETRFGIANSALFATVTTANVLRRGQFNAR